jgi:hypothetical protein
MRPITHVAALAALAASCNAQALGALADVTIIDRDSGATLSTYYAGGEYWVAGTPGHRYAVEVHNRSGGRLLAVTSVDGVNVLSGASAGWDQAGYVFDAGERYQVTGWRKSNAEVAAFVFTDLPNSYAARTGRPENVGVIGVAVFRERRAPRVYLGPQVGPVPSEEGEAAAADRAGVPPAAAPTAGAPTPSAPQVSSGAPATAPPGGARAGGQGTASIGHPPAAVAAPPAQPDSRLGTGHGEREYSYVVDTEFRRMQREPNEVIRIRYDSFENLVAMGIVRPGDGSAPVPNPFPRSHERRYVPDPPG